MDSEPRALVVGRIVKPHGIRGECVVEALSEAPDRFAKGSTLRAGDPADPSSSLTVAASRAHQGRLLVTFEEIRDRTAAEAARGTLLSIAAGEAAPLPPGRYYPHQIEGFAVRDGEGSPLGVLESVLEAPAHDVWVVRTPAGAQVMVPAVEEFVRSVDTDARAIVLSPIGGMFE